MFLSDTAIRRPILASMMSLGLILFGIIGYSRLPVREFPDVDPPVVSVRTTLRGANPRVIESAVTDILEEELSTVEGIRTLTSSSSEQNSNITIEFNLSRDLEAAAQDVRDKVARVRGRLPQEIDEPVVSKQDADARPFMWLALTGENYDLMTLSEIADRVVKPRLQTLEGVGRAQVFGERRYSMRIWLSAPALAARGLTVQDIESAVRSRNVEIPAGRIESQRREFSVRSLGELKTVDEFANLVVSNSNGQIVKLRDVARVEIGPEDDRVVFRANGKSAVSVGIVRQSRANIIEISDAVRAELPAVRELLPPGISIDPAFDGAIFVRRSIREAQETLLIAGGLVVIIIFVFLRNIRATIIPGLAIPASIIAAFGLMYFLGFTINNLTLLALILAIGIVVDDAIIVMENAFRHQETLGEEPEKAALEGTREIAFAVIATTVALVAVFSPLAFLTGTTGRLFNEFGIALAGAVVVSSFVALTLTPMLCAKILRVPKRHGVVFRAFERGFNALSDRYVRTLNWAVNHRAVVVVGAGGTLVIAVLVFNTLEREFVPPEDRGSFTTVTVAPEGASLAYTNQYQREVEDILLDTEEVEAFISIIGMRGSVNGGFVFSRLRDWSTRERSVQDVLTDIQPKLLEVAGVMAFANNPPAFGRGFGNPVEFVVRHPDYDLLALAMDTLVARARLVDGLINVDTDFRVNRPELTVSYDRDRAEDLDVPVEDVARTLQTLLGGRQVSTFTRNNKLYDVIAQLEPDARATPNDMRGLAVRGRNGTLVNLDQIARIDEGIGPRQLNHFDRVQAFTLSANLAPGFTLGEALDSLDVIAAQVLPDGSSTALSGESRELEESGTALYFAFMLAVIVVFMVLAAQFESLIHPFTVLLAVPLAVTGALVALLLAGSTLNLYSQIGMILLVGLVTKNSILLVEYANQLRARGLDSVKAMVESGKIRLRPILMTSVATIFGALPIALGLGAGSMSRRPLGYAIIGGLLFSTLLTLYLVPVVYVLFDAARERVAAKRRARAFEPAEAR